MYAWFQDLREDAKHKLFFFRGSIGKSYDKQWFKYELCSGPSFKIKYQHGHHSNSESMLVLGLFFFTIYLTFFLPNSWYWRRKYTNPTSGRTATFIDDREYGFAIYNWSFVWSWHLKPMEYSYKDPWWMHFTIHFDELLLGRRETLEQRLVEVSDIYFMLGEKEFKIDKASFTKRSGFRRHIPFSLYHKQWYAVDISVERPPQYSGKGENSWDCGDDGIYGIFQEWKGTTPSFGVTNTLAQEVADYYVSGVLKNAKRYGGSSSERGISSDSVYKYIGRKRRENETDSISMRHMQEGTQAGSSSKADV